MSRVLLQIGVLGLLCCSLFGQGAKQQSRVRFLTHNESGEALTGVVVCDNSGLNCHRISSGDEFTFTAYARLVRLVKDGYCPVILAIEPGQTTVEVELHRCSDTVRKVPPCSSIKVPGKFVSEGFEAIFVPQDTPLKRHTDIDYLAISISFGRGEAEEWKLLGAGPSWSGGLPSRKLVEESVRMTDHSLITEGEGILLENLPRPKEGKEDPFAGWISPDGVDVQGVLPDGRRWRYIGAFLSSTSYGPVSPEAADFFDNLLSTLCVPEFR